MNQNEPSSSPLEVVVLPGNWGNANLPRIERILFNASSQINQVLRVPLSGRVCVVSAPETDRTPRTLIRYSRANFYVVQLTATNELWCKYSYQFSHEFCHLLIDPHRGQDRLNQWVDETICELASVFTIRSMARQWETDPPIAGRTDYAVALQEYANNLLNDKDRRLAPDQKLSGFVASNEESLRAIPIDREKNAVIAYELLAAFESNPEGWNSIRCLPEADSSLSSYLQEWKSKVEPTETSFVERIIGMFSNRAGC